MRRALLLALLAIGLLAWWRLQGARDRAGRAVIDPAPQAHAPPAAARGPAPGGAAPGPPHPRDAPDVPLHVVVVYGDGTPAPDATVRVWRWIGLDGALRKPRSSPVARGVTDDQGYWRAALPSWLYRVVADRGDLASTPATHQLSGHRGDVRLVLTPVHALRGTVHHSDGTPARGEVVRLQLSDGAAGIDAEAVTDSEGAFALEAADVRWFEHVAARVRPAGLPDFLLRFTRAEATAEEGIRVRLDTVRLLAAVVDEEGRPAEDFLVFVAPERVRGVTQRRGVLDMTAPGREGATVLVAAPAGPAVCATLRDGEPGRIVLPRGVELSGRIVDHAGAPVTGARLTLHPAAHEAVRLDTAGTDAVGRFSFGAVAHEDHVLRVRTVQAVPAAWVAVDGVRPGREPLVITLPEPIRVAVRLRDEAGRPIESGARLHVRDRVSDQHATWADHAPGASELPFLVYREGTYDVEVHAEGRVARLHGIEVVRGAPAEFDAVLPRAPR